jgi:para-aminobenzoate synthetase
MKTLIIDNYDSFTFNLFQQIAMVAGEEPLVVANDQITLAEIRSLDLDAVVLSPGPGSPGRREDFGVCAEVLQAQDVAVLGVCLGYQGLGYYEGARVVHAPEPVHGRLSRIRHNESALFRSIPQDFAAVRYHSLVLDPALPGMLEALAWTADGILMALRHRHRPQWGIQFHPESICTQHGNQLIRNFLDLAAEHRRARGRGPSTAPVGCRAAGAGERKPASREGTQPDFHVFYRELPFLPDPEQAFLALYADKTHAFWLGSDLVEESQCRFLYMGAAGGPLSWVVHYHVADGRLTVERPDGRTDTAESIFDYLKRELAGLRCLTPALPFDFNCGFVGFFGYELKAECGGRLVHRSSVPDAAFMFSDRLVVFDRVEGVSYAVAFAPRREAGECQAWFNEVEQALLNLPEPAALAPVSRGQPKFWLSRPYEIYLDDIKRCCDEIRDGESYEICLTNHLHTEPVTRPLDLYRVLRRVNPAPYAAYLRFGGLAVLSSSPEQFLRADRNGWVSSRPIKGTVARHPDRIRDAAARRALARDEKDAAENLIVVDLLRNDLGRVCEVGSVQVPRLMEVESYATVHQLVSTVRGRLRSDRSVVDCLRSAFPGGSMTGAPKRRTLEILDRLEHEARGVYSGSIGFLALNGTADLSIVIRTAVCTPQRTSIGIGGAITSLSDPQQEFDETLLKARALIEALVYTGKDGFSP